jgi:multisubunit Na+/H+ antiporter MnhB subunit
VDTTIPLAAIRDLSIGHYPRSVSPVGCDLISLTYEDGGEPRQVLISPMEGWIGLPSSRNAFAAEWHAAIQSAVLAATGRAPGSTPANELGISQGSSWPHLLRIFLPVVITVLFIVMVLGPVPAGFTKQQTLVGTIVILLLMPLSFHWWIRRQATPVSNAPARLPQPRWPGWLGLILAVLGGAYATSVFVDFYANPTVIGDARIHPPFTTRLANWLLLHKRAAMVVGVLLVIGLKLFLQKSSRSRAESAFTTDNEASAVRPRWQGWDVWVIGFCLTLFGALWLLQLSEG